LQFRPSGLLCQAATEESALEHCAAFLQRYREDSHYLERTAPSIERKGIEWRRAQPFAEPDTVRKLAARFRYSQKFMQDDPWAQRAAGDRRDLHSHLATVRPATEYA